MDEEEPYPNFTAAYPTTASDASPQITAWNPAHRPNDSTVERVLTRESGGTAPADSDDEFFERYPGATPKKQPPHQSSVPEVAEDEEDEDEDEEEDEMDDEDEDEMDDEVGAGYDGRHRGSITVHHAVDVRHHDASREELARGATSSAQAEGPRQQRLGEREEGAVPAYASRRDDGGEEEDGEDEEDEGIERMEDDEAQVFGGPDETVAEQERELGHFMPEQDSPERDADTHEAEEAGQHPQHAPAPPSQASAPQPPHPEQLYEHQGEMTEIELALDEEPGAPLLEDEEAPPTIERDTAEMEAPSPAQRTSAKAKAAPLRGIDRSFTTNFVEAPPRSHVQEQRGEAGGDEGAREEWSQSGGGDDATFGELLGDDVPARKPVGLSAGDDLTFGELLDDEPLGAVEEDSTSDDKTFGELLGDEASTATMPVDDGAAPWSATSGHDAFGQLLNGAVTDAVAQGVTDVNAPDGAAESALTGGDGDDLAAAWQAALDDDELLDESNDLDPSSFFGDDDDGLLEDDDFLSEPAQMASTTQPRQQAQQQPRSNQYRPQQTQQQTSRSNPYAATSSFTTPQQQHGRSVGTPDTGLFDIYNTLPSPPISQQPQRPAAPQAAQSFADKSKGGYQSPYDLPMEVVKPRQRRARGEQQQQGSGGAPKPPPRTSSFGTPSLAGSGGASAYVQQQQQQPVRPPSSGSAGSAGAANGGGASARTTPKMGDSGFFADLPMTAAKPRTRGSGVYTPGPSGLGLASPGLGGPPGGGGSRGFKPQAGAGGFTLPSRPPPGSVGNLAVQPHIPQQQQQQQQPQPVYGGLRQPERLPLLPDHPIPPTPVQQLPTPGHAAPTRYSPAPATSMQPVAGSRYSPAPTAQPPGQLQRNQQQQQQAAPPPAGTQYSRIPSQHQYAPRTSSPLASSLDKAQPPLPIEAVRAMARTPPRVNGGGMASGETGLGLSPERKGSRYSPAESSTAMTAAVGQRSGAYGLQQGQPPPPRPRTQSPSSTMKQAKMIMTQIDRPTSAAGAHYAAVPLQTTAAPYHQQRQQPSKPAPFPHRRQFSKSLTFAPPTSSTSADPLERWKGTPTFHWNPAGTLVTTFPKQTPFYASHGQPSIKCTAGDIWVRDVGSVLPMGEWEGKFPGPLAARGKGRKKEVLAWMGGKIGELEGRAERLGFEGRGEEGKKREEKVLLWKVMRVFIENDGVLEGSGKIEEEVRKLLLPDLAQMGAAMELRTPVSAVAGAGSEGVDRQVLAQLRQALLEGQRERAVWLAEEKKLWGHAMLIASTMGPDVWKQIVQAFVRSQVKSLGSDARSLAALYQVFAGNSEDCVDELVPPSARAGFQMVSKADGTASGNPLEGLDQWRETLALVVGNRTAGDGASLVALGRLLSGYGRAEAAGICFLFARAFVKHSGADDSEAHFTLLGGDRQGGSDGAGPGGDMDAILLTEIYEWASSLAVPTPAVPYIPHLQAYKLIHAQELAAHGLKAKAQAYCDHITSAYTSTTRPSQYYHPVFTQAVADLSAFLSQTPHSAEGKGGLFGRPAMKTVSSGAASWFTKFVSGEDDHSRDAGAVGSAGVGGAAEGNGPFGRVSGEISRSTSGTELYNPAMMMGGPSAVTSPGPAPMASFMPPTAPQGRYAPSMGATGAQKPLPMDHQPAASRFTPSMFTGLSPMEAQHLTSPTEVTRNLGVPSLDQQLQRPLSAPRSVTSRYAPSPVGAGLSTQRQGSLDVPRPEASRAASDYGVPYASSLASAAASRRGSAQDPGSQGSYEPTPSLTQEPSAYGYQPSPLQQPYHAPSDDGEDAFGPKTNGLKEYELDGPDAETGGYEPPAAAYEPPSYQPYQPEPEAEEDEDDAPAKSKKKGIMDLDSDDEDQLSKRAVQLKKAQADRAAEEAFRRAAEADAERDSTGKSAKNSKNGAEGDKKASGGWLGGWFKKDPTAELNKPIRAKLGDQSSFVYDEQLKKWVNKKGGAETATPAATSAPPPRGGPPSRMASAASGPPSSGPPSRVASAAGPVMGAGGRPMTAGSIAPQGSSGPPSRAATPASSGSAFQLSPPGSAGFGAPPASFANGELRSASGPAAPSSAPPSRPATTVMSSSTASNSLDDLLAGPRKAGGTVKGKKKGRYVDVMAK
ncbi:vesicle coat component [Friedmanniomyces endolithicus]|uniref:Protein transport protein sec16 n=1 Tax=Friedmanniomyces endolithicus TaxID=329885 RepID=A0AAN6KJS6_9PEZI|nr:vesicle coat component [Friedmanniomyces endolithicus]KAK0956830.1 vesicle coat component [Friedmanniomyces endolithicus]KAK0985236.1 vesicle coat component [Friedmanniomyces endolithicus]